MEALLNTAPCGFLRFSDQGNILQINASLLSTLGYSADELVGEPLERILPTASRIFHQTHFFPLLKLQNEVNEVYFSLHDRNGQLFPMLVNARRSQDADDPVNDCVFIQMRQRSEYEDEILKARKAAEQAVQAKDEFLAMVSHELRTPLSAIKGWSHLLTTGRLTPADTTRAMEAIERSSEALQKLIEDLLDFSRIISGKLRLTVERVDVNSVIESALDVVRPAAEAKEIRLEAILDSHPPAVSGDPSRLQQVLWNLLSNAIKFTPKHGRVQVRLSRVNSSVEIAVSDTGDGISEDFLPYVFDRFRQSDRTATRERGGLGLGLSISRHLVELHGGGMRVESGGPGLGSTFFVKLPVMIVNERSFARVSGEPVSAQGSERPSELGGLENLRILIVEDDADARRMLTTVLEHSGAHVVGCAAGNDALSEIQVLRPDVLVSDIELPDIDGHFLIRSIRALGDKDISNLPAIALTAHSRPEDRVRALAAGFHMHITKPVEPIELVLAIANLTNRQSRQKP